MQADLEGAVVVVAVLPEADVIRGAGGETGQVQKGHQTRAAVVITGDLGERSGTGCGAVHRHASVGDHPGGGLDVHDARGRSGEREPDIATTVEGATRGRHTRGGPGAGIGEGLEHTIGVHRQAGRPTGVVVGKWRGRCRACYLQRGAGGVVRTIVLVHQHAQLSGERRGPDQRALQAAGIVVVPQPGGRGIVVDGDLRVEGGATGAEGVLIARDHVHQRVLTSLNARHRGGSRTRRRHRATGQDVVVGALCCQEPAAADQQRDQSRAEKGRSRALHGRAPLERNS